MAVNAIAKRAAAETTDPTPEDYRVALEAYRQALSQLRSVLRCLESVAGNRAVVLETDLDHKGAIQNVDEALLQIRVGAGLLAEPSD